MLSISDYHPGWNSPGISSGQFLLGRLSTLYAPLREFLHKGHSLQPRPYAPPCNIQDFPYIGACFSLDFWPPMHPTLTLEWALSGFFPMLDEDRCLFSMWKNVSGEAQVTVQCFSKSKSSTHLLMAVIYCGLILYLHHIYKEESVCTCSAWKAYSYTKYISCGNGNWVQDFLFIEWAPYLG